MTDDNDAEKPDKPENPETNWLAIGLALGPGLGLVFGVAMGNIGVGLAFGISIGLIFGIALNSKGSK